MRVLGLETSCDETAAAVVETGEGLRGSVLSDVVHTQKDVHEKWGGVVPELASRDHLQRVLPVLDEALRKAGCELRGLDGIAVTRGPGLVGALLVGVQVAKSLAAAAKIPLVGVNHIEGHLMAVLLSERAPAPPWLGLVVSGGHTSLYEVRAPGEYRALGHTLDDAAGEAFDKVCRTRVGRTSTSSRAPATRRRSTFLGGSRAAPARRSTSRSAASRPRSSSTYGSTESRPDKGWPTSLLRSRRPCATRSRSGRCARRDMPACRRW